MGRNWLRCPLSLPKKKVMEVSLHWDCLPKVEEYDYNDSDPVPAKFFKGKNAV